MAYYDRQDIPFHYELADAFTICDAYHCSVPTSTSPNRNYWVSGYTGYEPLSPNPTESVLPSDPPGPGGRAVTNAAYNPWHAGYGWTTVPERLQSAGISWKTYQEWDNFGDNNLEYFTAFKKVAAGLLGRPSLLPYEIQTLAGFYLALPSMPARSRTQRYWPSRMLQTNCRLLIANSTIAHCTDPGPAPWPPSSGRMSSRADCRKSAISFRPRWIRSTHRVRHRQRAQHCSIKYSTPSPPIPICGRRRP